MVCAPIHMEWYRVFDRRTQKEIDIPHCPTYDGMVPLWEALLDIDDTLTPKDVCIYTQNDRPVH